MSYLPQEEICPISEQLLLSLYDAAKRGLPVPVGEVPPDKRSSVALFCYRRSHLEEAALAVAATCEEQDLVEAGGHLGRTLFLKSRNSASPPKNNSLSSLKTMMISLRASPKAEGEDDEDEIEP
jgi:hypothetical protein